MTIELASGDLRLVLDPDTGGAIAAFTHGRTVLLRPVSDARLRAQHGRAVAGYPLIPFANRLGFGRFSFGGQSFQLAPNFGDEPHTIHGNAWMHAWTVTHSGPQSASLALEFSPQGGLATEWPFAYRAEQVFELASNALQITLRLHNTDTRPAPVGLGLHPYVAREDGSTLRFEADSFWTTDKNGLPADREAAYGRWEFDDGHVLTQEVIDTCYAGWGGTAALSLPQSGLTLTLESGPPMDHLQLYTPAGKDYVGLEPVSNMPDAVNRMDDVSDNGLVVLQPGGSLVSALRIVVD